MTVVMSFYPLFLSLLAQLLFDAVKSFLAENVFYLAGIGSSCFRRNTQLGKKPGQKFVTLINLVGNSLAGRQQDNMTIGIHGNITVFPQFFHGNADAGLADAQIVDHVDGSDRTEFFLQRQNGLQIILCGLVDLHGVLPFCTDLHFIRVAYCKIKNKTLSAFGEEKSAFFRYRG